MMQAGFEMWASYFQMWGNMFESNRAAEQGADYEPTGTELELAS